MPTNILLPKLGETVVEGTVSRWLADEGQRVEKLAPLLEISTEPITYSRQNICKLHTCTNYSVSYTGSCSIKPSVVIIAQIMGISCN